MKNELKVVDGCEKEFTESSEFPVQIFEKKYEKLEISAESWLNFY